MTWSMTHACPTGEQIELRFFDVTNLGVWPADLTQVFVDRCVEALNAGELTVEEAAEAKWWCTELQKRTVDRCVQLHGGYGYMLEYPIARAYLDARVTTIYGGTTEIMKGIIGRKLTRG